jgi:outer membrane protein TolC
MDNNNIVKSRLIIEKSKIEDIESVKSQYYPTIDIGGVYQRADVRSITQPGEIYNAYVNIGIDLYDGGRKSNLIKQNETLLSSAKYDTSAYKKTLQLNIVKDFYAIKSTEAHLKALEEKKNQLKAELQRIKKFYEVGSATKDEEDKLQAAYSNNIYQIEAVKYQILSLKKLFTLKTGVEVSNLDDSYLIEPTSLEKETSDSIQLLQQNAKSLSYTAKTLDASYLPQVRLEDTYSIYKYGRYDATHLKGLDNQNVVLLSVNIRIFDKGTVTKQKNSLRLQKMALDEEIKQEELAQDINLELSISQIHTAKAQIDSAKSSLKAAISAYETIAKKYKVGNVDNIAYLDALSVKTNAKAQYEVALNNLQVAYASYYYYANKNIKEFIK